VNAQTPPYIDLHERGSYDTDELDALEAATRPEPPAPEEAQRDAA
jgi:hypothetical protein